MKTYMQRKEDVTRTWYVVDAEGQTLGRLATKVANVLRGKHKPTYTPHIDGGDYVIVVNANKVVLTGNKLNDKMYYNHSRFERAVKGMLPKGRLGRQMYKKLFVYAEGNHPHSAQQPVELKVD